jgi:diphthamide synthase (EF-2-diphthine--ammonia ligase)
MPMTAAGLPLFELPISYPCSNADYERIMSGHIGEMKRLDIGHIAFGDLFLEDIRRYRERQLQGSGMAPLFPLWGEPTGTLARTMIGASLKAAITCVDPKQLAAEFSGRFFDASLLASLPPGADPCGENGEFHTFAFAGPMFHDPVDIEVGETVPRDGFVFTDLLPR